MTSSHRVWCGSPGLRWEDRIEQHLACGNLHCDKVVDAEGVDLGGGVKKKEKSLVTKGQRLLPLGRVCASSEVNWQSAGDPDPHH
jgi:hypothetical protein